MKTKKTTDKLPVQYRAADLNRESMDVTNRTVKLSFSSDTPVERGYGFEILDHSPESVDLSRMNGNAPLLVHHNANDQVGVVESATVDGSRGEAVVRFSRSARAEEIFQDVMDGIRKSVSVGYRVLKMELQSREDDIETYRVTSWLPMEVSLESMPADITVGVGRSEDTEKNQVEILKPEPKAVDKTDNVRTMSTNVETPVKEAPEAPKINIEQERSTAVKAEQKRSSEIFAIGRKANCLEDAEKAVNEGRSIEDFQRFVLENKFNSKPIEVKPETANVGMDEKEVRNYSLAKAIREAASGSLSGLEKEASDATAKQLGREARGFFIPNEVAWQPFRERAMEASTFNKGGAFIEESVLGSSLVELLRNKTIVNRLGARNLSGLVGNIAIPKQSGGATAYWLAEGAEITDSSQALGQLSMNPKRLGARTAYTKQFLAQSSIGVESFIREDLMSVLAIEKDRACITGDGASGEPKGVMNTTGIGTVTFGATATRAKAIEFQTDLAGANAHMGSLAYVTTPTVAGKWMAIDESTSTAQWLWKGNVDEGQVVGRPAYSTNQVPDNKVIYGNFSDLIVADWAGMDVVVDPYTLAASEQVRIIINMWTDIGVRHAESFSVSTDAGNQ